MRKIFYSLCALLIIGTMHAQSYVAQVLVLNEGYYDYMSGTILTPVTVGSYDPASEVYTTITTIDGARFASDIKIDGDVYYVAADHFLNKYDLNTHALLASADVTGIRKIAIAGDQIVVTRGEYLVELPSYVQVYDKNDLSLQYEITALDLPYTTEGVSVIDNKAYIAVNNGFVFGSEVGQVAVLDLASQTISENIDLGINGINPDNLMVEGDYIYTLNNKDFTGSSISSYRISTGDLITTDLLNVSSGCGTSAINAGTIYYQEMFNTTVTRFDAAAASIVDETDFGASFYGLAFDPINGTMYTSVTDYFSYGTVNMYATDGTLMGSFDASVSPGAFAFDVRLGAAVENNSASVINMYPNPATEQLTVQSASVMQQIRIMDIAGRQVAAYTPNALQQSVDCSALAAGTYAIQIADETGVHTSTFIKQ